MSETAYKTTDLTVIEAWENHMAAIEDIRSKRTAMADRVGRRLMVNRSGFGHGTRIVGFERHDDDKPGDLLADGALRVMKNSRTVQPNRQRKAGKALDEELRELTTPDIDLPGMPSWHLGGDGDAVGLRSFAPALWLHEGTIYALWGTDSAPVECPPWEQIPLSAYYAAHEAHEVSR